MGFFRRHFDGSDGNDEREARSRSRAGGNLVQRLEFSPDQVSWANLENALERCAASLTLVTVRLERLSEYYDRNFAGSDHAGVYEQSAEKFRMAASGVNVDRNLLSHPGMDFDGLWECFESHARDVGRALDMPESAGYEKNVDETMTLMEETLRDVLALHYRAADVLRGFRDANQDKHIFCEGILRSMRGGDGHLAMLFAVYFNLSSLRMLETHPGSLTFVPDVAYDSRLIEGWKPYQIPEPVQSGRFSYAQPARFEFDPNLTIIRTSNSEEEYEPLERVVFDGKQGILVPCCSEREASYYQALIEDWVATLGPGGWRATEFPDLPF
ncbi:MAG: hypothetical protein WBJ62_01500 [Coriobacteriia bacterium]